MLTQHRPIMSEEPVKVKKVPPPPPPKKKKPVPAPGDEQVASSEPTADSTPAPSAVEPTPEPAQGTV